MEVECDISSLHYILLAFTDYMCLCFFFILSETEYITSHRVFSLEIEVASPQKPKFFPFLRDSSPFLLLFQ
jgi:hypothetical protein